MTQNIMVHRHNKWRLLIRNRRFRFEVNQLLQEYSEWVNGPPLGVVIYENDDFVEGELDRADILFGGYGIMDHDDDPFLRGWRRFNADWGVTLPKRILSDNFPLLDDAR